MEEKLYSNYNSNSCVKPFVKYVSLNIVGMIGLSAYILADVFFISLSQGADGIAALGLVLPIYNLIFAIGSMIGVGSATKFSILRARKENTADLFFSNAIMFALMFSIIFILPGIFMPEKIIALLGGDARMIEIGTNYTRIFMTFAPAFMCNPIFNAFVRNDGHPLLAMIATFTSSIFNIVMDYIFMFPMGMGMEGAALATSLSPIVGILICSIHFLTKKHTIKLIFKKPSITKLVQSCQLGSAAFVGEMSSGVTTIIYNFLILSLVGNIGVAAYSVISNTAIVATSIFNGIAQGSQPLLSDSYGKGDEHAVKKLLSLSIVTGIITSLILIIIINVFAVEIIDVFNSENSVEMASYAVTGIKLYFIGYLFAGFNIIATGALSASESAVWAFVASILRGFIAIIICSVVMSKLFGITGVWLSFATAEFITTIVIIFAIIKTFFIKHD